VANSVGYHEAEDRLGEDVKDRHRALASMMEELEAADWYDQRVAVTTDPELREILAHNRDEEKEHFVMTLEWLRRRDPKMDAELRERLFRDGPIVTHEDELAAHGTPSAAPASAASGDGSLGIGSLKGKGAL
jgi:ferritin-like protein